MINYFENRNELRLPSYFLNVFPSFKQRQKKLTSTFYQWLFIVCLVSFLGRPSHAQTAACTQTVFPAKESVTSMTMPVCWTASEGAAGSSVHWEPVATDAGDGVAGPYAGTNFFRLSVAWGTTSRNPYYLTTKAYALPANRAQQLRYAYFIGNKGYKGTTGASGSDPYPLTVQISNNNGSTWTDLYNHSSSNSFLAPDNSIAHWRLNILDLSAYKGQTVLIRFKSNANYGSATCNQDLDEIIVEGNNCPVLLNPTLSYANLTASSVDFRWSIPGGLTISDGYIWELRTTGAPGSGNPVATGTVAGTSNSVTVNGLTPLNNYTLYLASNCNGSSPDWFSGGGFKTPCSLVQTTYPSTESVSAAMPNCWYTTGTATGINYPWAPATEDAATGVAGPYAGTYFFRLITLFNPVAYNPYYLTTKAYVLPSNKAMQLRYAYYLGNDGYRGSTGVSGTDPYPLTIQVTKDNGLTWNDVYYHSQNNSMLATSSSTLNWQQNMISLDNYIGQTVMFRFKSNSNNPRAGFCDQALDEITVEDRCASPASLTYTNVTSTSIGLTWATPASGAPGSGYVVEVRSSGVPGSTNPDFRGTLAATSKSVTVSGLMPSKTYIAYISSNCGATQGSWISAGTIITPCTTLQTVYPVTESASGSLPPCWFASELAPGATVHWETASSDGLAGVSAPYAGSNFFRFNCLFADNRYGPYYLTTKPYTLVAGTKQQIRYFYYLGADGYHGKSGVTGNDPYPLTLQISKDKGFSWSDLYRHSDTNSVFALDNAITNWQQNTVSLETYAGQTVLFRFVTNSKRVVGYPNQALDEITVEYYCTPPASMTYNSLTTRNVNLTWAPVSGYIPANGYIWEVRKGQQINAVATGTTSAATTSVSVQGLTPGELYTSVVSSNCGGAISMKTLGTSFRVPCDSQSVFPAVESASASMPPCWSASVGSPGTTYQWEPVTTDNDRGYGVDAAYRGTHFYRLVVAWAPKANNPYYLNTKNYALPANGIKQLRYAYFLGNKGYKGTTGASGADPYPLTIQISQDNGNTWTDLYNHSSSNTVFATSTSTVNWQQNTISLANYSGKVVQIRFKSNSNYGSAPCNQDLDEITIEDYQLSITVNMAPKACIGNTVTLTASGATTYTWMPGAYTGSVITVTAGPAALNSYTVIGMDANNNTVSTPVSFTVSPNLAPTLTVVPSSVATGTNGLVTITATGADTYTWMPGGQTSTSLSLSPPLSVGQQTFSIIGQSASGCQSVVNTSFTVYDASVPSLTLSSSSNTICVGSTVTFTAQGADSYVWQPGGQTDGVITLTVSTSGLSTYTVTGTNASVLSSVATISVFADPCTGIEDLENKYTTQVYPNPSSGKVYVHTTFPLHSGQETQLRMMAMDGNCVFMQSIQQATTELDIAHLPAGVYYLEMTVDQRVLYRQKLILQP